MGSGCGGSPALFYFLASRRGQTAPVILSDRRESKDLRTDLAAEVSSVRRSFGALRLLRMTRRGSNRKGHPRRDTPTLSSYHTVQQLSIICARKVADSLFYTKVSEVICAVSRLEKRLEIW